MDAVGFADWRRSRLLTGVRRSLFVCAVAAAFVLYRSADFFVWDDSPNLMSGLQAPSWSQAHQRASLDWHELRHDPIGTLCSDIGHAFGRVSESGYRPLSHLQQRVIDRMVARGGPHGLHLFVWGLAYGATALALFSVARRYLTTIWAPWLAVWLVFAAPPATTASWVVLTGFQMLVPLSLCVTVWLHRTLVERPATWRWSLSALLTVWLLAPWIREFGGLCSLLVLVGEGVRARRPTWLGGLAALGFLHAVYPTALLIALFGLPLPWEPVHRLGYLGGRLQVSMVHWYAGWHFVHLFPPTLWVILTCGGLTTLGQQIRSHARSASAPPGTASRGATERLAFLGATALWGIGVGWALVTRHETLPVWLVGGVLLFAFTVDMLLAVWFALSFFPILRVFTQNTHFLYACVPFAIVAAVLCERLWLAITSLCESTALASTKYRVSGSPLWRLSYVPPWLGRAALAAGLLLVVADHGLNLYHTRHVMRRVVRGMREVARVIDRLPHATCVVCNAIHGDELAWLGHGGWRNIPTVDAGVMTPDRAVLEPAALQTLLDAEPEGGVFLLDVRAPMSSEKRLYHEHKYVHRPGVETASLGLLHQTRIACRFLDPLKHFVPPRYVPYLGPPDLVNDFYMGPALDGGLFRNELFVEYRLFRVTDRAVRQEASPCGPCRLVRADVRGFNVLTDGRRFFAIPCTAGPFDPYRFAGRHYAEQFTDITLDGLLAVLDRHGPASPPIPNDAVPRLLEAGFRSFNLVAWHGHVIAIPQSAGAVPALSLEEIRETGWVLARTLRQARHNVLARLEAEHVVESTRVAEQQRLSDKGDRL